MNSVLRLFIKVTAAILCVVILSGTIIGNVFADIEDEHIQKKSLASALQLVGEDRAQVIVKFDSPSSSECSLELNSPMALRYEKQLLKEQDAILDKFNITPEYRYTGIINGVAITATAEEIHMLENTRGVEGVYLVNTYEAPDVEIVDDYAVNASEVIGAHIGSIGEYTGDGVVVAVVDSGLALEHEAFNNTKYVTNPRLTSQTIASLGFASSAGYLNEKIPFYYDYVNKTSNNFGDERGHGTHVAGVVGGYAENEDGTVKFSGVAPGAQFCAMRVLDENGSGNDVNILAALEDAYKLDVDIINLSLGSNSGFSFGTDYYLRYDGIFGRFEEKGTMVVCAIGNSGAKNFYSKDGTLDENYVDYGTAGSPALLPGNIGVGSANNSNILSDAIKLDGELFSYTDLSEKDSVLNFNAVLSGKTVDIVYLDALGNTEDYEGVDVGGKIVAVNRGVITFTEKCENACKAGAIALIVVNNEGVGMINMFVENQKIPAILIEHSAAQHLNKTDYVVTIESSMRENPEAGHLSSFSSIGVTPDLQIAVDILGVGDTVFSADINDMHGYIGYRGTSLSCPVVSGAYALLYESLMKDEKNEGKSRKELADYIEDVSQSTATVIYNSNGHAYSPRSQGSGLINVEAAIAADAYFSNPIISLDYDKEASGKLSMEYELISISDSDKEYYVNVRTITDSFSINEQNVIRNTLAANMLPLGYYTYKTFVDGIELTGEKLLLPAGESVTVKIEVEIYPQLIKQYKELLTNGFFLDGFVELYDVNDLTKPEIHAAFISFQGDWLAAPAIEPLTEVYILEWLYEKGEDPYKSFSTFINNHPDANFSYSSVKLGKDKEYHIGQNPLAGGVYIPYNPDRNAISAESSDADEVLYDVIYVLPSLLRNCKKIEYVVADSNTGKIYGTVSDEYVRKDNSYDVLIFNSSTGCSFVPKQMVPDELGEMFITQVPSGTEVTISVYTLLDHPDATEKLEMEVEFTVDYVAPEILYDYNEETKQLTVTCSDSEYLAGIVLTEVGHNYEKKDEIGKHLYSDDTPGVAHTEVFDLSDYEYDNIHITVADYAGNVVNKMLSLKSGDISNIEADVTIDAESGIDVDIQDGSYLYKDVEFSIAALDGYCFTEDLAVLVNGTEVLPVSVENGVRYYSAAITGTEIVITVSGAMQHNYVPEITVDETCTDKGELTYICSNCSHVGKVESVEPHDHKEGESVVVVKPSCSEEGLATVSCTECGVILATKTIPATGHTPGEYEVVIEDTCTNQGFRYKSCTECGKVLESEKIEPHDHVAGEFVIVEEATCTQAGLKVKSCSVCGHVLETESIPAKGHAPGEAAIEKEATCTQAGLEVTKCSDCGILLETKIIPAKGHDSGEGKDATAFSPAVCGVCGEEYGAADSSGIVVTSLALSSASIVALIVLSAVLVIKKRK